MNAAPAPESGFWVPEIWFEPWMVDCLREGTPTVLFVVLQSRRATPLVDVVLDLFHVGLRDSESREHVRALRFEIGSLDARSTLDLEQGLEPVSGPAVEVHDATVMGCLRGRDAATGIELVEPVAFWCDGEDRVYLHPAPLDLARDHPSWGATTSPRGSFGTD